MSESLKFLGDIFEGTYRISQLFGRNPQMYKQFGMKGHNGVDWALPVGVPLLSGCKLEILKIQNIDKGGYGFHVKGITYQNERIFELVWGHFSEIRSNLNVGDVIAFGTRLGLSGNSGYSTGAHLHFGIRERYVDSTGKPAGVINYDNGFYGYFNPLPYFDKNKIKR